MATAITAQPTMSVYMQNTFINHVLRSASAVTGSYVWVALYNEERRTNSILYFELSGSGYARASASGIWAINTTTGSAVTSAPIIFPSASPAWGRITHLAIMNNPTGGSIMFWGPVSASKIVEAEGDSVIVLSGELGVKLTGAYSVSLSTKLLSHYLKNSPIYYTPGSSVYLALYNTPPTANDDGTGREVSGSVGYSRIQFPTSACWVNPVNGSTCNTGPVTFALTTSVPWGRLKAIAFRDHPTAGSMLFFGSIYPNVALINPDGFRFDAYGIKIYPYVAPETD